jgi:signal transduction histidine kinase
MENAIDQYDQERRRLARQLHSTAAQQLAALQINLSLISSEALSPRAQQALAESSELAQACAREIRAVCNLLHPPLLDEVGLPAALRAFATEVGCRLTETFPEEIDPVPEQVALGAFRIVEGLALNSESRENVTIGLTRHAEALYIWVAGPCEIRTSDSVRHRIRSLDGKWAFWQTGGHRKVTVSLPLTTEGS